MAIRANNRNIMNSAIVLALLLSLCQSQTSYGEVAFSASIPDDGEVIGDTSTIEDVNGDGAPTSDGAANVDGETAASADTIVFGDDINGVNSDINDVEMSDVQPPHNEDIDTTSTTSSTILQHTPPTHFQITAHIQTDLHTGYSYFLPPDQSFANLPFLECGAVGSTTEGVPLVSGVFRHVPRAMRPLTREGSGGDITDDDLDGLEEEGTQNDFPIKIDTEEFQQTDDDGNTQQPEHRPQRPSPPKYVVALSPLEITVGGNGSNETQSFGPGDVIFIEDTWWGVWNEFGQNESNDEQREQMEYKMKGYTMQAHPDSQADLNVLMLTVPPAIHRHWKNAQHTMMMAQKQREESKQSSSSEGIYSNQNNKQPWWKLPSRVLRQHSSQQSNEMLPKPCSLESDPAFSNPSVSSTTLSQHFTQHFTKLIQRYTHPHPSFLPHHHQDLLLPVLAQTTAATLGGATAFVLVLQLSRFVPVQAAVGFGGVCIIALGTWGIVWLGEEILDEWELWGERRRLERRMSEGRKRSGGSRADTRERKSKTSTMMQEDVRF